VPQAQAGLDFGSLLPEGSAESPANCNTIVILLDQVFYHNVDTNEGARIPVRLLLGSRIENTFE
jgi:hypothetical protein